MAAAGIVIVAEVVAQTLVPVPPGGDAGRVSFRVELARRWFTPMVALRNGALFADSLGLQPSL